MTSREVALALAAAGIEEAEHETAELFRVFCGVSPAEYLWRHRSSEPPACESPEFLDAVRRRLAHEPLAYIIGEREFFGRPFRVTPDVLIPRADTEVIVEAAIARLPRGAFFFDLCSGSGCIAISILCERPDLRALLVDISPAAIAVSRENAERLGVSDRCDFLVADLLADRLPEALDAPASAVISNPPYIESGVVPTLSPEVLREPHAALDGGDDGLIFYRRLTEAFASTVRRGGFILYEIGYDQGDALRALAAESGMSCEILRDYGDRDRVAVLS